MIDRRKQVGERGGVGVRERGGREDRQQEENSKGGERRERERNLIQLCKKCLTMCRESEKMIRCLFLVFLHNDILFLFLMPVTNGAQNTTKNISNQVNGYICETMPFFYHDCDVCLLVLVSFIFYISHTVCV